MQHLVATVAGLGRRGVELRSSTEGIDTTAATDRRSTSSLPSRSSRPNSSALAPSPAWMRLERGIGPVAGLRS